MKLGIVGLPNVGKSTLFNAITKAGAEIANYPFCTIEPNVGIVSVPDERLDYIAKLENSAKKIEATTEFIDIAGLVKGASHGEGLGNQFLSHIREVDALVHVCRCFDDQKISHVSGKIDPVKDFQTIELELILADLEQLMRREEKVERMAKSHDAHVLLELDLLQRLIKFLDAGNAAREFTLKNDEEKEIFKSLFLLTAKPILIVANVSEEDAASGNEYTEALQEYFADSDVEVIIISAQIEAEIQELEAAEQSEFLQEIGLKESGLNNLIKSSYKTLGLISFLTAGPKEARAWSIPRGYTAPEAAGVIHSDFQRGFIAAEVIAYDCLRQYDSLLAARKDGQIRKEGKDYIVQDGDIILFRFNV